jgi:hypothetical protein
MEKRTVDAILSVISIFLWFAPFNSISRSTGLFFNGTTITGYQSGQHLGAFALLLLLIPLAYAYFSWNSIKPLQKIAAYAQLAASLIFFIPRAFGSNVRYGLVFITAIAAIMVFRSVGETEQSSVIEAQSAQTN